MGAPRSDKPVPSPTLRQARLNLALAGGSMLCTILLLGSLAAVLLGYPSERALPACSGVPRGDACSDIRTVADALFWAATVILGGDGPDVGSPSAKVTSLLLRIFNVVLLGFAVSAVLSALQRQVDNEVDVETQDIDRVLQRAGVLPRRQSARKRRLASLRRRVGAQGGGGAN